MQANRQRPRLIDDGAMVRTMLGEMRQTCGGIVRVECPRVVITDLVPPHMNGLEVAESIRLRDPDVPSSSC
jgi:CheY-like chemotaxis protein